MLKQTGSSMGDKIFRGNIPNMQFGEYRYYPQDNPNIDRSSVREISKKTFIRILKRCFPEYIIDPEPDDEELVWSVGKYKDYGQGELHYQAEVINKGYICFKEAKPGEDGRILYLHDGHILAYKERWVIPWEYIVDGSIFKKFLCSHFEEIVQNDLHWDQYCVEDSKGNQAIVLSPDIFRQMINIIIHTNTDSRHIAIDFKNIAMRAGLNL